MQSLINPIRRSKTQAGRRLSVAIYIHDLSPGGVERQSLVLAKEFQARGIDTAIVVHRLRGELIPLLPPEITVTSLDSQRTLGDVPRLRRFLKDHPIRLPRRRWRRECCRRPQFPVWRQRRGR